MKKPGAGQPASGFFFIYTPACRPWRRRSARRPWPVHRVPPGFEIVGAAVLVVQVIGVLPDVVADRTRLPSISGVSWLGASRSRACRPCVDGDEHPAGAEDARAGGVEVGLQLVEAAEIAVDRGGELAVRPAAARAHDLPEHGVIGVAAELLRTRGATRAGTSRSLREHVLDRPLAELRVGPWRRLGCSRRPRDGGRGGFPSSWRRYAARAHWRDRPAAAV